MPPSARAAPDWRCLRCGSARVGSLRGCVACGSLLPHSSASRRLEWVACGVAAVGATLLLLALAAWV